MQSQMKKLIIISKILKTDTRFEPDDLIMCVECATAGSDST